MATKVRVRHRPQRHRKQLTRLSCRSASFGTRKRDLMGWNDGANQYEAGEYAKAITTLKVGRT